jgi:hypothetical protein
MEGLPFIRSTSGHRLLGGMNDESQEGFEKLNILVRWRSRIRVHELRLSHLLVLLLIGSLSGCFPNEGPTPYEPPRVKADSRDYPGITPEQVLAASEKIFQLADGSEMNIQRDSSRLEVKRSHESLVYKSSWERWRVDARAEEGATYVTVSAEFEKEGSKIYPRGIGAYHLFFARLDYMLGASKNWMTCPQYEARLMKDPTWGHDDRFLCANATDNVPEGPMNFKDG